MENLVKRDLVIDNLRFILICIIVLNHFNYNLELLPFIYSKTLLFNEIPTPALGLISGLLFFNSNLNFEIISKKITRRIRSLLLPFVLWSFILLFIYNISHLIYFNLNLNNELLAVNEFSRFNLINYFLILLSPQNSLWYLQNLTFIMPFTYGLNFLLRKKLFLFFFLIVIFLYHFEFNIFFSVRFLPFFLLGAYLSFNNYSVLKIKIHSIPLFFLLITSFLVNNTYGYDNFILVLFHLLNFYIFYVLLYNFLDKIKFDFLAKLSNYSFFIYLTHIIINSFITKSYIMVFGDFLLTTKFSFIIINLIFFIISISISVMMAKLLEKRFYNLYSILVGKETLIIRNYVF